MGVVFASEEPGNLNSAKASRETVTKTQTDIFCGIREVVANTSILMLKDGRVIFDGISHDFAYSDDPYVRTLFTEPKLT
jgi:ABC-type transporter Mla maintaining outer membrane lipid asymmetry ATPase subunit MlaF